MQHISHTCENNWTEEKKKERSDSVLCRKALHPQKILREKGRDLTQSYDKNPIPVETSKGQSDNTNNATKKFDYTAIADRLRTVRWSNNCHPTGVVKLVYGYPTLPLTAVSFICYKEKIICW